jgi:hypothetical protein
MPVMRGFQVGEKKGAPLLNPGVTVQPSLDTEVQSQKFRLVFPYYGLSQIVIAVQKDAREDGIVQYGRNWMPTSGNSRG